MRVTQFNNTLYWVEDSVACVQEWAGGLFDATAMQRSVATKNGAT